MEWDWFEFEVAKRVWKSLLRADLTQTPKAKLFSAFLNAMDDNRHARWFDNSPVSEASDDQDMEAGVENPEPVVEVVKVPHNGGNAVVGAQESANNAGEVAVPGAQELANNADQNDEARARQAALNVYSRLFQDSESGSTVSDQSRQSERQQQRSGSVSPIPALHSEAPIQQPAGQAIPVFRSEPRVQQDTPRPAPISDANIRRHNYNHTAEVDEDSDYDSDDDSDIHTPLAPPLFPGADHYSPLVQ